MEEKPIRINWYPGHMAKARRELSAQLSRVDFVVELCDARIPLSSRNPELLKLISGKEHLLLLNKADLANETQTQRWLAHFRKNGIQAIALNASKRQLGKTVIPLIRSLMRDTIERNALRGVRRTLRGIVIGVPNVGKSTFINALSPKSSLKAEDRPGVTRSVQWVKLDPYLELMDTPGMLWPRLDDQDAAKRLAYTSAISDQAIDTYGLAIALSDELISLFPLAFTERFRIADSSLRGQALLDAVCRGRGFFLGGAVPDEERAVQTILSEYRNGRIGHFTLDMVPQEKEVPDDKT